MRFVNAPAFLSGAAAVTVLAAICHLPASAEPARPAEPAPDGLRILVFTKTAGYRHKSIDEGLALVRLLGRANGFAVEATEDAARFDDEGLEPFSAVVWLNTTGDVLDQAQQAAFERFIRAGGGYVGVHAAADTEYDWPWYGELLGGGAWFRKHPKIQDARLRAEDRSHVSSRHYGETFSMKEEWYNFAANPRTAVRVLLALDEASYDPGSHAMGPDHPIAWYHEVDGGRSWYTGLGHREQTYADSDFQKHLLGGILWAAGR